MELNYYLFATYVFVLVCAVVIICKYLFADVKRQRRMLDEKEKQLLDTYRTLEDAMDEYYALIAESREEIEAKYGELESRLNMPAPPSPQSEPASKPAASKRQKQLPKTQSVQTPPGDPDQLAFDQLFEDAVVNASRITALHEKIVAMTKQGMARAEIAKELKITQTEVDLVSEMRGGAETAKQTASEVV